MHENGTRTFIIMGFELHGHARTNRDSMPCEMRSVGLLCSGSSCRDVCGAYCCHIWLWPAEYDDVDVDVDVDGCSWLLFRQGSGPWMLTAAAAAAAAALVAVAQEEGELIN